MVNSSRKSYRCLLFTLFSLWIFSVHNVWAEKKTETVADSYGSTQLFLMLHRINLRLDAIRFYMGKPEHEIACLDIHGAVLRGVYFQAVNLYKKTDRLALEITRTTQPIKPLKSIHQITDNSVYQIVSYTFDRINLIASSLGINIPDDEVNYSPPSNVTASDIYEAILEANQKTNHLLDKKYSPSDVFQQLTKALHLTFTLYERFPETRRIERVPKLSPGKKPGDVYQLLLKCFNIIREIVEISNLEVIELSSVTKVAPYTPSEVYDIATLLTSELQYIHDSVPGLSEPVISHFPGRKYPFHVYQRGQMLYQALLRLRNMITENPDWRAYGYSYEINREYTT